MDLGGLWLKARQEGISVCTSGQLDTRLIHYLSPEWEKVKQQTGAPSASKARPTRRVAPEEQPLGRRSKDLKPILHTAGSHLPEVPDIVHISFTIKQRVEVSLWSPHRSKSNPIDAMNNGMFIVGGGMHAFLSPVRNTDTGDIRFDPRVMRPADERAKSAHDFLTQIPTTEVISHRIPPSDGFILLDNRHALHSIAVTDADSNLPVAAAEELYYLSEM